MEIIDMTLATSMAVIQYRQQGHGAVIAQYVDELRGLAYKPMLVGSDFLYKTGLMKIVGFS